MKTETRTLYQFGELSADAQEYAIACERKNRGMVGDVPWLGEIEDSYRAIIAALGLTTDRDGDPEPFRDPVPSWVSFHDPSCSRHALGDLRGARATAWVENNLLAQLRVRWTGPKRAAVRKYGAALRKYGAYYLPGTVPPCPFTGVCFDDDFLLAFTGAIKAGDSLDEAAQALGTTRRKLYDAEADAYYSADAIETDLAEQGDDFLVDGSQP